MSDKGKVTLDWQVQQSRKIKALTAENNRQLAEIHRLREALRHIRELAQELQSDCSEHWLDALSEIKWMSRKALEEQE